MSNDELKQLREEWSNFFRWTVSISIFLITASLTVLTFQEDISGFNRVTVYTTVEILMANIFLSWLLLKLNILVLKTMAEYKIRGRHFRSRDDQIEFNKKTNRAKPMEKWTTLTFILGMVSFIIFLISYIR